MSGHSAYSREFFVAGGTLRYDAASYVLRPADEELYHLVRSGQLCYVLTTRQMGKSSLMNRLGWRLQAEGVATALIDLTTIGTAGLEAWYLSLLDDLQVQLALETDAESWWDRQSALSPVKRFTKFIRDVVLAEVKGQVAIFIDEVDSALNLEFSDDFFAAIRAIHNQTVSTEEAGRLSFVLLGVATPNELIKSRRRTPFNIGERIDLGELDLPDAAGVFTQGLPAPEIINRVYYWTAGHPYLMQRVCQVIAREERPHWSTEEIDALVAQLFFTERALVEESNLQFVNGRLLASPQKEALLKLYRNIHRHRAKIQNDERHPLQNELKLYGLVKTAPEGHLEVRNRIYRRVFDQEWIKQHQPVAWRRYAWPALVVVTILSIALSLFLWQQSQRSDELLAQTYITNFNAAENPTLRLDNLAQLIALNGYTEEAVALFTALPPDEQAALFANPTPDLQPQIESVIEVMYMTQGIERITAESETTPVLEAMLAALQSLERLENPAILPEIDSWLQGRSAALQDNYEAARLSYSVALSLNEDNPAIRYERALVALALPDNEAALADLTILAEGDAAWQSLVQERLARNPQLHSLITAEDGRFETLAALVPVPTSTTIVSTPLLETDAPAATAEPSPEPTSSLETMTPTSTATSAETVVETAEFIQTPLSVPQTTPNGRIVYTCFIGGVDQICAIDADGSNFQQLTASGSTDWTASFVTGLNSILFSSSRSGAFTLYEMSDTGENILSLSTPIQGDYSPIASPDGRQIAFTRAEGGSQNIWLMNRDGSSAHPLTSVTGDAINASWSPDGGQIAYSYRPFGEEGYALYIMNADGSESRRLPLPLDGIGGRSDWSPDGRWLAFYAGPENDHDLYLAAVDGSVYYQVTDGGDNLGPSFSPDGNWLVFTSGRDGDNDLYLVRLDGTFLTPLTLNDTSDWQPRWGR